MRQGCLSLGDVRCDNCHRIISYLERYLAIDEEDGVEVEKGNISHYCLDCCLEKGYARCEKAEKEGEMLTFFPK